MHYFESRLDFSILLCDSCGAPCVAVAVASAAPGLERGIQRRLPALAGVMRSMRDFYMELQWAFESPVLPFISRLAPSDTYRIWKRGPNLRADITLAGFDGFR